MAPHQQGWERFWGAASTVQRPQPPEALELLGHGTLGQIKGTLLLMRSAFGFILWALKGTLLTLYQTTTI